MDKTCQITTTPLVSILMLTYNRARYIKEAIESVRAQSYSHWELIIIDDGSTDETPDIVSTIAEPRIKYCRHSDNLGLISRRQESLRFATGPYTAILDSDDVWTDKDKLKKQVEFLAAHSDHCLVGTNITLIDGSGATIGQNQYATSDKEIRAKLLLRNQFAHSSVLIRTAVLKETAGYRDTHRAEDLDLFLQLGLKGKLANLPDYAVAYRIHSDSFNPGKLAMAIAVHQIIHTFKHAYPGYPLAWLKSTLRLVYLKMKSLS